MSDVNQSIAECCKKLRLSTNLAAQAASLEGETHQDYLINLLTNEIEYRKQRRITQYSNSAGFPKRYLPDEFRTDEIDFPDGVSFQSLLDLEFYKAGKNIIMYGGTGTGKTMLSILIGLSACKQEIPVRFFRTAGLINQFSEAQATGNLSAFKKRINKAQIIILDEFGYVPYDRTGSQLMFDYLSEIHEQKSVILNTNLEFSQWVNVLYDPRMTTALIGRLTHHVDLILFPGVNNRLRESSINASLASVGNQEL
ncbi:MAG: ATP-binding protein [Bacteroidaceae bacterium]|nr:ATP-binding protein [Bacteroidaceae bacterium]